jgi:hypothetical protein
MDVVRDTPSSDGACVYEVSLNYLEQIKSYGPDKQKVNGRIMHCVSFFRPVIHYVYLFMASHTITSL